MRTSSGPIAGSASSRRAACGSTPAGSSTRCSPSATPLALRRRTSTILPSHSSRHWRTYRVRGIDSRKILPYVAVADAVDLEAVVLEQPYEYRRRELGRARLAPAARVSPTSPTRSGAAPSGSAPTA